MPDRFLPRPDLIGRRTMELPFDLDAGDRGQFRAWVTLQAERIDDPLDALVRPSISRKDFVAWLGGRGADNRLAVAETIERARRANRAGNWEAFVAGLRNGKRGDQ